jgi:subtilisin family serine protease
MKGAPTMNIFSTGRSIVLAVAALTTSTALHAQRVDAGTVPVQERNSVIAGRYIVLLRPDVPDAAAEALALASQVGGAVQHVYSHALKGFSATLPDGAASQLRNRPGVVLVEQDRVISLDTTQNGATWGLDRIDQESLPLSSTYEYVATGAGVRAFVIDTGIRATHTDFGGRVQPGYTAISDGNGTNDCNGHGTHVAGTIGGLTWGVAKAVQLVPVRVLNCQGSGTTSGVIAGVDWVAAQTERPAVANMSLGGGASSSLDAAVAGAVGKGVTMVVAAGNSNANACNYSPAREQSAVTVGATTSSDARASYSNYGSCVDLFAPGSSIRSAWSTSDTATNTLSGTSMASPHVAGVTALILERTPTASPAAVWDFMRSTASVNKLSAIGTGSPNLLVYSLGEAGVTEPPAVAVAVDDLTGRAIVSKRNWKAEATVTIKNLGDGSPVGGATVSVTFNPGGTSSCITSAPSGACTVASGTLKSTVSSTKAAVTAVSGTGMTYSSSTNDVSEITITK